MATHATGQASKPSFPFIDGMTIRTEDVAATIEVRVQSLGPGACATRFLAGTHSVDILAPLLSWSEWHELTSHLGSVSVTLNNIVMCDTGVVAEVRYFPGE